MIGVVSGYRYEDQPVLMNGQPTGITYRANSGLVIAYGVRELMDYITIATAAPPIA